MLDKMKVTATEEQTAKSHPKLVKMKFTAMGQKSSRKQINVTLPMFAIDTRPPKGTTLRGSPQRVRP